MSNATSDDYKDDLLESGLANAFKHYRDTDNSGTDIATDKARTYETGILAMTYATHNVQRRNTVQHGYTTWGQKGGQLDFFKIMNACCADIPKVQLDLMFAHLREAVGIMKRDGQILEDFYDSIGIDKRPGADSIEKEACKFFTYYYLFDVYNLLQYFNLPFFYHSEAYSQ